jgi:DNA-binding NarL/FixJ family response regulator
MASDTGPVRNLKSKAMARIAAQPPAEKKRILVADAFPMLRHGLVAFLNAQPDMIVCGEADSIPSALIKIAECKPHLLVIGLRLGAGDCVEFVKALKVQTPGLLILVYSGFEESIFAMRALRAGASGYLMKRAAMDEMLAAISDILRGEIYVSRELAMQVFKEALETQPQFRLPGRATHVENLSDREMHVFHLLGSGLGTKKIAHSLNLSVKTIETHREHIKHKLGLNSGQALVERATKYVEETLAPRSGETVVAIGKKKLVRFPAGSRNS